ncbi:MAG: hypothetical protein M1840_006719 [Geoglossum simile]|nr:MAG: hypothetical protein M1840_006719 [Geoglossum simile]
MNATTLQEVRMHQWGAVINSGAYKVLVFSVWNTILGLLTLLYRTVATRLFKPYSLFIFGLLNEDRRGWQTDQLRVAIVNAGSPISALTCGPVYRAVRGGPLRERCAALLWWIGALIFALLPLTVPLVLTKAIPGVSGVPGSTDSCAMGIGWSLEAKDNPLTLYTNAVATDMLRLVDRAGYNFSGTTAESVGLGMPNNRVVVSDDCPGWASVCDRKNSLRVDVDFWIKPSDLNIGADKGLEGVKFGVLNTCYKVESHTKVLREQDNGTLVYGLMYGGALGPTAEPGVTVEMFKEESFGNGYSLDYFFNISVLTEAPAWQANDTLSHDGDRTLLIYHIMAVVSNEPITDPLFATASDPIAGNDTSIYLAHKFTVPIMCNTSYSLCNTTNTGKHCNLFNGGIELANYVDEMKGNSMSKGFLSLMVSETDVPMLYSLAGTTDSILASQTLSLAKIQKAPGKISGHSEIMRLALASRMKLVTSATRAAETWGNYIPSWEHLLTYRTPSLRALCKATLISDPERITTSLIPVLTILITGLVAILLTFTGPIWRLLFWKRLSVFTIRWRLRTVGQLHRSVAEGGDPDKYWPGGCIDQWPEGKGEVETVGLVDWKGGYHAVYNGDSRLKHAPREMINSVD